MAMIKTTAAPAIIGSLPLAFSRRFCISSSGFLLKPLTAELTAAVWRGGSSLSPCTAVFGSSPLEPVANSLNNDRFFSLSHFSMQPHPLKKFFVSSINKNYCLALELTIKKTKIIFVCFSKTS
jgi:hypothetical protein